LTHLNAKEPHTQGLCMHADEHGGFELFTAELFSIAITELLTMGQRS
jgi:hypothetical protein